MRQVKPTEEGHAVQFNGGPADKLGSIRLIGRGRGAYLWIGGEDGRCIAHASGPKALRALAFAILDNTGGRDA